MYILDNKKLYPKLNFTYESKIGALLKSGFSYVEDAEEINYDMPLLMGVFGHPFLATQTISYRNFLKKHITKFKKVFVWIEDMHKYTYKPFNTAVSWTAQHTTILTYNRCQESHQFKMGKWLWIPHHIDLSIYTDLKKEKNINVLCYGSTNKHTYPVRHSLLSSKPYIVTHPSYQNLKHSIHTHQLAELINRAHSTIVCPSIYQYAVAKYWEIAACGSKLFGESCPDIDKIGLIINADAREHNLSVVKQYGLDNFVKRIKECLI